MDVIKGLGGRFDHEGEDIVQSSGRSRGFGKGSVELGEQSQELGDDLHRDAGEPRIVGIELSAFGGGSQLSGS